MRILYLCLGMLNLGLGIVGVFLPVLPTTPFILVAAYCFSRSSERFYRMLLAHRIFGPIIRDWESGQVIRPKAKFTVSLLMVPTVSYPVFFLSMPPVVTGVVLLTVALVLLFIWTRPSEPVSGASEE